MDSFSNLVNLKNKTYKTHIEENKFKYVLLFKI
jgi:hypothetical protein